MIQDTSMNKNQFSQTMAKKSETELKAIISDDKSYIEDARLAASWELEARGQKSNESIEIQQVIVDQSRDKKLVSNKRKKYITDDPSAPELYTKQAIIFFSVFFSTVFGAFLLMSNLKTVQKRKARFWALTFGVCYTILMILILNQVEKSSQLGLVFNLTGAVILSETFWNRRIGKELKHRKKKIWKPLIISIIITIPFVLAIVYG
ncbi:hypothetical protein [Echinicola sp. 20G]|uniref:hypothetical protein n=1 Tax=Echinicola sp. 20G TaxID=2781961 RepID=UPI001910FEE9|nr:hypothetical protein [Echinicola sp. 20G]